jgi:hypothetical protein
MENQMCEKYRTLSRHGHCLRGTPNDCHAPPPQRRTLQQLLPRLDMAIAKATIDDVSVDEVNTHKADPHIFL